MILDSIQKENDIHKVPLDDFPLLAEEIRSFLLGTISKTGGHLSSNLGAIELTLALHNVLQFPEDVLIWDVGHQAYTHKLLTGRREEFATLRKEGGLSGFPKRSESPCDAYDTGHSSNSISAGLGYVYARELSGGNGHVVSVIGDGALTGGLAFEGLNNAATLKTNFIIVLNDNNMSISKNVGGLSTYLSGVRTADSYVDVKLRVEKKLQSIPGVGNSVVDTVRRTKSSIKQLFIPGMLFEDMGIKYLGPVDGHNMRQMMKLFNEAKKVDGAVIVHVITKKGYGYGPAREHPDRFHGTGAFDLSTGRPVGPRGKRTYTQVFSKAMVTLGRENHKLLAITAAMPDGTGLKDFGQNYPRRFFDVGIAEGHAVSFAAGLALGGFVPVVAVYSSFLQRAFDQLMMDVCMQGLHVVFAIDRAGLVGPDGETHQGLFDLSYLGQMPGMQVMAPAHGQELVDMLRLSLSMEGPVALRYSKEEIPLWEEKPSPLCPGKAQVLRQGEKVAIWAVGSMVKEALSALPLLEEEGITPTLVNARFVKPFDTQLLLEQVKTHSFIVTVEENVAAGGFGERVTSFLTQESPATRVLSLSAGEDFVPQGSIVSLRHRLGLDAEGIARQICQAMTGKEGP